MFGKYSRLESESQEGLAKSCTSASAKPGALGHHHHSPLHLPSASKPIIALMIVKSYVLARPRSERQCNLSYPPVSFVNSSAALNCNVSTLCMLVKIFPASLIPFH